MLKMTFTETPVAEEALENTTVDMTLLDENNRPTPLLIGLVALELCWDIAVGYVAYRIFKGCK